MPKDRIATDDIGKTGVLIGTLNLALFPLYWADSKLGVSAALLGTAALLYSAHEVGKNRRPVENAVSKAGSFFAGKTGAKGSELENAMTNIAVGGAALFDQIIPEHKKPK